MAVGKSCFGPAVSYEKTKSYLDEVGINYTSIFVSLETTTKEFFISSILKSRSQKPKARSQML